MDDGLMARNNMMRKVSSVWMLRNIEGQKRNSLNSFHLMTGIWLSSQPLANNLYFRTILATTVSFRDPFYIPLSNKHREFITLLRSKESTITCHSQMQSLLLHIAWLTGESGTLRVI
jgi:hypothetical protein